MFGDVAPFCDGYSKGLDQPRQVGKRASSKKSAEFGGFPGQGHTAAKSGGPGKDPADIATR